MTLRTKILLLSLLPLLLVAVTISLISFSQAKNLSEQEIETFERTLLASKKQELRGYVELALDSIAYVQNDPSLDDVEVQRQVKSILHSLTYGEDGYFFLYDRDGVNLVHPIQPELVGQNLINLQDNNGDYVIQNLLRLAREGGGFHRYLWKKPSLDHLEDKLSYVVQLPRWQWMLGTGLYLDDIAAEVAKTRNQVKQNIRNTFLTVLVIVTFTMLLTTLIGVAMNIHGHRQADERLQDIVHRYIRMQVAERRRFSRELHDGINQLMVSAKFRIELAMMKLRDKPDAAEEDLDKANQVLSDTIKEVRRISHDLRPSLLDDKGLEKALSYLIHQYSERTGIEVSVDYQLDSEALPEDIEITLYRVIQEALTNTERHAQASNVDIVLSARANRVVMDYHDNGVGFDPSQPRREGIGLRNMRERVELVAGVFELESSAVAGTSINVKMPIELRLEAHPGA